MASNFKGVDLFGSGPHRFKPEPMGEAVTAVDPFSPGTGWITLGPILAQVNVEGRLVAADEAGLRVLLEAIRAQLILWPEEGTLENHAGHTWPSMSFGRFVPAGLIEHGRVASLAYTAQFYRVA